MIPKPDHRLLSLFERAAELDPGEHARFLDHACPDDRALRNQVEAMLSADRRSTRSILVLRNAPHPPGLIMGITGEYDLDSDTVHAPPPGEWLHNPGDADPMAAVDRTVELKPGHSSRPTSARPPSSRPAPRPPSSRPAARPPTSRPTPPRPPRPPKQCPAAAESALGAGTRIHHDELIREIGRGGMGAVFMARAISSSAGAWP